MGWEALRYRVMSQGVRVCFGLDGCTLERVALLRHCAVVLHISLSTGYLPSAEAATVIWLCRRLHRHVHHLETIRGPGWLGMMNRIAFST